MNFRDKLEKALTLDVTDPLRPKRVDGRPAAVMALFDVASMAGDPALLLTQRTETVESHKGQISFPGGVCDLDDFKDEGFITTALRETEEEVGIPRAEIDVVGALPEVWTPTGFLIRPVVGLLRRPATEIEFRLSEAEVHESFWAPLSVLQHMDTYKQEQITVGALRHPIHVFYVDQRRIWGATAAMIKNLLDRLSQV